MPLVIQWEPPPSRLSCFISAWKAAAFPGPALRRFFVGGEKSWITVTWINIKSWD